MARGRPKKLTPEIADQIIRESDQRPTLKAPAMRQHLLRMYRENLRKKEMSDIDIKIRVNHYDKKILPGVSTIQKFIAEINTELKELDKPWSTVSLAKYPIPPEALPTVLRVWARLQTKDPAWPERNTLTIREALWVSRLYCLIKQKADETDTDYLDRCWGSAHSLATAEKVLNSAKGGYPEERVGLLYYWLNDASLYNKMAGIESFAGDLLDQFSEEFVDKAWPLYHQKWLDKKKKKEAHNER